MRGYTEVAGLRPAATIITLNILLILLLFAAASPFFVARYYLTRGS